MRVGGNISLLPPSKEIAKMSSEQVKDLLKNYLIPKGKK